MSSFYVDSNKHQERIIYIIVAENKLIKGFSDASMAKNACLKIRQMSSNPELVLDPIPVKLIDSQAVDSKGWDRVDFG